MNEETKLWHEYKQDRQQKRSSNRGWSLEYLRNLGIRVEVKNGGAHLVVQGKTAVVDFWPGTGKFIPRGGGKPGRGVKNLVKLYL